MWLWRNPHLKLICAGLAAHHMAAGAECSIYLLLAAEHAQQSLSELLQTFLQGAALLAAATVQPLVLLAVPAWGAWRGVAIPAFRAGNQVHHARVVERSPSVVVHFLGGTSDVKNVLFAQVDVFVEEEWGEVALEVSAVLHHHCIGNCVTPEEKKKSINTTANEFELWFQFKIINANCDLQPSCSIYY